MGRLIPLHDDAHREAELLLPWYVTGEIEPEDKARVEAHIGACLTCQADLRAERRLSAQVAALPLDAGLGWMELRRRLDIKPPLWQRARDRVIQTWSAIAPPGRLRWFVGGQLAFLSMLAGLLSSPAEQELFHALGTPQVGKPGNMLVMFRPDATDASVRSAIAASQARIVDGPTEAGAYVLAVDPQRRPKALASLKASEVAVLAEPIDAGAP